MNESELIKTLSEYPKLIMEKGSAIWKLKQEHEETKLNLKVFETNTLLAVAQVKDRNDKPVFSNDLKREAETERRLSENSSFIALKKRVKEQEIEIVEQQLGLEFVNNTFGAAKALSKFMGE